MQDESQLGSGRQEELATAEADLDLYDVSSHRETSQVTSFMTDKGMTMSDTHSYNTVAVYGLEEDES